MFSFELLVEICIHKLIGFTSFLLHMRNFFILYYGSSFIEGPYFGSIYITILKIITITLLQRLWKLTLRNFKFRHIFN